MFRHSLFAVLYHKAVMQCLKIVQFHPVAKKWNIRLDKDRRFDIVNTCR
jgi:hypothetical protein